MSIWPLSTRPAVIAHRGNSTIAPQNTMAAFEAAWRAGADFFELDIQVTADGEAAVIHNMTVDETTNGSGAVASLSSAEITALDNGSWFSPTYAGERVPLLSDVVEFLRTHDGIGLVLEIKDQWPADAVTRALTTVSEDFLADRLIVESFQIEIMTAARDLAPHLRRDLLIAEADEALLDRCRDLGVAGVGPDGRLLLQHPDLLGRLHDAGLSVNAWTLNEPEQWAMAVAAGVDGIVTDRPDRLHGWLAAQA